MAPRRLCKGTRLTLLGVNPNSPQDSQTIGRGERSVTPVLLYNTIHPCRGCRREQPECLQPLQGCVYWILS